MTWRWRHKTLVCRNALGGTPLNWHRINRLNGIVREHSRVSLTTATFIMFWWLVIHAKESFFGAPDARVWRLGTFVNVLVAVATSKAINTATHGVASVGLDFAR